MATEYAVRWPKHIHAGEELAEWTQRGMGPDKAFAEEVALKGWNHAGGENPPYGVVVERTISEWVTTVPAVPGVSD